MFPRVKVECTQLVNVGFLAVDVERLRLVYEGCPFYGQIDDILVVLLPDGFVDAFQVFGNLGDVLHAPILLDDLLAD